MMGGALGTFLNYYAFPLFGLSMLALGVWCTWTLWRSAVLPSLGTRVAALILGMVCGWFLANLDLARDAAHVTIGFPMPVMILVKGSGRWLEVAGTASIPCLVLDLAIGVGMVNALLRLFWKPRPRVRKVSRG